MLSWPILSVTTFLPLVGALFIMMLGSDGEAEKRNARWVALWTTLITFAISLVLVWRFDAGSAEFQFVERRPWLAGHNCAKLFCSWLLRRASGALGSSWSWSAR